MDGFEFLVATESTGEGPAATTGDESDEGPTMDERVNPRRQKKTR